MSAVERNGVKNDGSRATFLGILWSLFFFFNRNYYYLLFFHLFLYLSVGLFAWIFYCWTSIFLFMFNYTYQTYLFYIILLKNYKQISKKNCVMKNWVNSFMFSVVNFHNSIKWNLKCNFQDDCGFIKIINGNYKNVFKLFLLIQHTSFY